MARRKKELPILYNIEITGFAAEGKAVAKVALNPDSDDKIVVFIPYAAPGDVADVKLRRKKHSYAEGEILNLLKPSEERIEPICPHFSICGGCKWQHLAYPSQLKYKQQQVAEVLRRISKVELPEVSPILGVDDPFGYRNKMEYTFSNKKWRTWDEIKSGVDFEDSPNALGFHIPGAFDKVLHISECHLQKDLGNRLRNFIYNYADDNGLSFYDIRNNSGLLRTLMLRLASSGKNMLCLSFGDSEISKGLELLQALNDNFPELTSIVYAVNLKANDTLQGLDIIPFKGKDYIEESMGDLTFRVNAKSFYQTNSEQALKLYEVARDFAGLDPVDVDSPQSVVYDLYTGTGTIANFVARQAKKVIGIEYVEEAIEDAKINSAINGIDNTEFFAGDMKDILTPDFIASHSRPDIMIIDPPRAGMHEDVIKTILNALPDVIVYVSCNPATQARDLALLDSHYIVTNIQPVDMFPHTQHVENVCRLVKR
ncbi:MAG: 23S rRNA (uracil(1939)-C(5))-methyltransferase RlmD [Clostridium sp.]|nr:23S rRNA (uracil(1939)-C(5))-methyltransferase RlmD [Prevotella sp.]MCM1429348.1 23S rRNA (uracil(1939)-C(5))-methyltransferase RlmD [Clostridium sp.]MCM1475618.1 23S rRNA (uracil(1939)-C(5))-methyltransferase RlmD [Muribaculaceae bacterium]